jgi:Zn-dependent peptidase ImmA (M78 family)
MVATKLRRGFKSEAEQYALDFRKELQLGAASPLNMFTLAKHLEVPVLALSAVRHELSEKSYAILVADKSPMSAMTIYPQRRKAIVFNDSHAPTRQQSDIGHELSHIILGHEPSELTDESGGRHFNKVLEEEALCLSATMLVPRPAAFWAAKRPLPVAAEAFGISVQMMRLRLNQTGAMKILGLQGRAP